MYSENFDHFWLTSLHHSTLTLTHNGHEMIPKARIKGNNNKVMMVARDSKNGKIMSCHSMKIKSKNKGS